jgi:hypothetical protein
MDNGVGSSPASARVEDGVAAPGPPSSDSVEQRSVAYCVRPGEVGGEDEREVTGDVELGARPEAEADAVELSTLPAGLADLPPILLALAILGILFPINPLFSDTLRPPAPRFGIPEPVVTLGIRLPTRPLLAGELD